MRRKQSLYFVFITNYFITFNHVINNSLQWGMSDMLPLDIFLGLMRGKFTEIVNRTWSRKA